MATRLFLATCAAVALAGVSLAQTGPGQTLPGWGGTPAPQPGQPAPPGGLVTVSPGRVVVTFYTVQPADMTASHLMRTEVRNLQDERIGRIEDLVIGGGREIAAVVVGIGGFLGIGERLVALPPGAILLTRQQDGTLRAVVDATREHLQNSPEFKYEGNLRR